MSGNPFRPNTKRVRIQTPPPLSPDTPDEDASIYRVAGEGHAGSPPPSPSPCNSDTSSSTPLDAFSQTFGQEVMSNEALENTRKNSAKVSTVEESPQPAPSPPPSKQPSERQSQQPSSIANPFRRTMANSEPKSGLRDVEPVPNSQQSTGAKSTSPLDVDAFTRMMIAGKGEEQNISLQRGDMSPSSQKSKPVLPRHRHGRSLTENGPPSSKESLQQSLRLDTDSPAPANPDVTPIKAKPPPPPPPRRSSTRNISVASSDQTSISETASSTSSPPSAPDSPPHETNPYRRFMRERAAKATSSSIDH